MLPTTGDPEANMPETTLRDLVSRIDQFDQECEDAQHTDTGDAWDLLHHLRKQLLEAIAKANAMREALDALIETDDTRTCPFCSKNEWGIDKHHDGCPLKLAYTALGYEEDT